MTVSMIPVERVTLRTFRLLASEMMRSRFGYTAIFEM